MTEADTSLCPALWDLQSPSTAVLHSPASSWRRLHWPAALRVHAAVLVWHVRAEHPLTHPVHPPSHSLRLSVQGRRSWAMARGLLLAICLELCVPAGTAAMTLHVSPVQAAAADGSAGNPTCLGHALRLAAAASDPVTVEMQPGVYSLREPLRIPGNTTLRRSANGSSVRLSGGVRISGWVTEAGQDWLYRAPLPEPLQGGTITQLFVAGQRRGAARSPTMRFAAVTPTGLQAGPRQLLMGYLSLCLPASPPLCLTASLPLFYASWAVQVQQRVRDAVHDVSALDRLVSQGARLATY